MGGKGVDPAGWRMSEKSDMVGGVGARLRNRLRQLRRVESYGAAAFARAKTGKGKVEAESRSFYKKQAERSDFREFKFRNPQSAFERLP